MKKLQNVQYGRYAIFVVVLVLFLLTSHAVFAKDNTTKITGQEHRSEVAKIVQELRRVAGQDSTIGQEVRKVAQEQEDSAKKAEEAINNVDKVSKFKVLFLGTDYKNLGALRSELVTTQNAIDRLTKSLERITDISLKADIQKQIDALKATLVKAEAFAKDHESQFSFLGWFVRLFVK
ncbi:MAG: hypothetical protein A2915_01560 [Candidatus Yanofskybacteria bacterium RIFCSPLOWO2_01_FULL_41_34]|uniref:DUF5667 domain-containing protein n=1 Tax=Candidatus Yanofskybacteria bacterium RIFCSPHIGHO2_01_FULL_41_26 TaxID=1802661 RepID=A0A1F8EDE4_9BACT|nr:MAG: hypothetical protein A2649_02325 [Candidatus Yanofskybacteria bacterium RIFCSPHIGHO2_01_FULL_41_26]OGN21915.1 MAG: hypothetical protein A2915_01560 [Candidatus Yanofskybacteria bacterium RIFCSPLOWO2_01_FULL_41_34]